MFPMREKSHGEHNFWDCFPTSNLNFSFFSGSQNVCSSIRRNGEQAVGHLRVLYSY